MHDWLSQLIFWLLWFPIMALVMGMLAKARTAPRIQDLPGTLRHSRMLFGLAISGMVLFGVLTAIPLIIGPQDFGGPRKQLGLAGLFTGGVLLFGFLLWEVEHVRHQLIDGGIRYQPLFRRGGLLKWNEVQIVRYSPSNKWFRLDGYDGQVVRVSAMMVGLPDFASVLLQNVSPNAIDTAALPVLIATSEGHPPRLW